MEAKMLPIRKILGSTDFSIAGYPAVVTAGELADHFGAELVLMHVVQPVPPPPQVPPECMAMLSSRSETEKSERDEINRSLEQLNQLVADKLPKGLSYRALVKVGSAADEIVRLAESENVDLLVIATHGRTGWRRLAFGSVAEKVIRTATRPVLVVQSPSQAPQDSKQ
jgi:nucleotide-binding universal stress UspA family protein